MPLYVVKNERGPGWDWSRPMRQQDHWKEHAACMDRLAEERFILAGGPVGEGRREGALLVVEADSAQSARGRLEVDPWVKMGLLVVASIEPWTILLGRIG